MVASVCASGQSWWYRAGVGLTATAESNGAIAGCALCASDGGVPVFRDEKLRVIRVDAASESGFPAFYRVVWNAHTAEFSDLSVSDRATCMEAVARVEATLRAELQPTKINLASLGNMVAHVHWHVIARFDWDTHFPQPVWAAALREPAQARLAGLQAQLVQLDSRVAHALAT